MRLRNIALPFLVLCLYQAAYAQDSFHIYNIPFARISAKVQVLDQQLEKQTEKYLYKLQKQERQLQSRLWKKDSLAAKEIFSDIEARYDRLKNSLASNSNVYSPRLGSMQTALRFVQQQKIISDPEVQSLLNNYQQLQKKLNKAAQIRKYLKERQQYLQERLDLTKELRKLQKQVYYYRAQLNEYKQALDDPSKLEAKLLQLANKIPAFKDFFAKNSILSSLFHLPGNDPMALATPIPGLQTRASIQQDMAQRFGTGPDVSRAMQQNIQSAQAQINQLLWDFLSYEQIPGGQPIKFRVGYGF